MKKKLLTFVLITTLLTTNLYATELPVNKQDMLRSQEPVVNQSEQLNLEESTGNDQHYLIVIFATIIIITIVSLASIFITRFALSLRGKEEPMYIPNEEDQE